MQLTPLHADEYSQVSWIFREKFIAKYSQKGEWLICSEAQTVRLQLVLNTTIKSKSYLCCIFHPIYNMFRAMVIRGTPVQVKLTQPVGSCEWPTSQHCDRQSTSVLAYKTLAYTFTVRGPILQKRGAPLGNPADCSKGHTTYHFTR